MEGVECLMNYRWDIKRGWNHAAWLGFWLFVAVMSFSFLLVDSDFTSSCLVDLKDFVRLEGFVLSCWTACWLVCLMSGKIGPDGLISKLVTVLFE